MSRYTDTILFIAIIFALIVSIQGFCCGVDTFQNNKENRIPSTLTESYCLANGVACGPYHVVSFAKLHVFHGFSWKLLFSVNKIWLWWKWPMWEEIKSYTKGTWPLVMDVLALKSEAFEDSEELPLRRFPLFPNHLLSATYPTKLPSFCLQIIIT